MKPKHFYLVSYSFTNVETGRTGIGRATKIFIGDGSTPIQPDDIMRLEQAIAEDFCHGTVKDVLIHNIFKYETP
jgi:hypothetical protein